MTGRGPYTREFKWEAVRLLRTGEKPAAQVAQAGRILSSPTDYDTRIEFQCR